MSGSDEQLIEEAFSRCRKEYENEGDPVALVHALHLSTTLQIPLPEWANEAWRSASSNYLDNMSASLDDALQLPRRRKPRQDTINRRKLAHRICQRINELLADGICSSIEAAAYQVEIEFADDGIEKSSEAIAKIYYDLRDQVTTPSIEKLLRAAP